MNVKTLKALEHRRKEEVALITAEQWIVINWFEKKTLIGSLGQFESVVRAS